MDKKKLGFEDFIKDVDSGCAGFVTELHNELISGGCKIEVKEAKSGFVVSYLYNKKTIANYVFRKKGLIIRIYANKINEYMPFLDSLPAGMQKAVTGAPICKRLINPDSCNPKCATGYDFILNGERLQLCRYSAFMFLLCEENNPFIKSFLLHELRANACA